MEATDGIWWLHVKWPPAPRASYAVTMEEPDRSRYILLTTFKRDGTPVSSPVWITGSAGSYEFTTGANAWKSRRLRADARVRVQVCNVRGRIAPGSKAYTGTGEILADATDVVRAERALSAKYGWQFRATKVVDRMHALLGRGDPQRVVAIRLRLAEASPFQGRPQGA